MDKKKLTSVLRAHLGHGPSWHISRHKWLFPTGPQLRIFSQTWPQLGIESRQDFLEFCSKFFLPHGHVLTIFGVREQISQFSESLWQILVQVWFPQAKRFPHIFPQENTRFSAFSAEHSTDRSVGWLHWHFWRISTWHGSQAPLWQIWLQICTLQFKSFLHKFLQMGKVPQRPVWLVLPHGQVLCASKIVLLVIGILSNKFIDNTDK